MNQKFLLPNGQIAVANMESHFLLIKHLEHEDKELISAAFGKPTFSLSPHIPVAMLEYWKKAQQSEKAIQYGPPEGHYENRKKVADALSKEYKISDNFNADNVIFTVGGVSALHSIFYAVDKLKPNSKIVTPLPYYPWYQWYQGKKPSFLHYINLIANGNLTLNASALRTSLETIDKNNIGAFLFCDPSNPSSTTPGREEWLKIAQILQDYPNIPIILDEAYREMVFVADSTSLISVAQHLLPRIILLRSATKGLSAAGERMAVVVTKNKDIYNALVDYVNIYNLNTPLSTQFAYAETLSKITPADYVKLGNFYKEKVFFMKEKLQEINALPKNITYNPQGTFYLIADLSKLKGKNLNQEAAKTLLKESNAKIETDVDIATHLLFEHKIALSPLSFFGVDSSFCWLRITCADNLDIMNKIFLAIKKEI